MTELPSPACEAPFGRAPEGVRTVFVVTLVAASAPLLAGLVLFGWRAGHVTAISIAGCVFFERVYFRVTRVPALLGRTHGVLTGLLLALTLPAFAPWYVPLVAAAFAIIVGKAVFGGVGHFLWQPALVGRLAVAVLFAGTLNPTDWPILAQNRILIGDVTAAKHAPQNRPWQGKAAPDGYDAFKYPPPAAVLSGLTDPDRPQFSGLVFIPSDLPRPRPTALMRIQPVGDLISGTRPGGIGETCAAVIVVAGLYLIYRNYVKWQLPASIVLAATATLAVAPVYLAGPNDTTVSLWWPAAAEGLDVGFIYICCQLLSGELMLAAFFLAPEMTSRPVTTGGQVIFGVGVGSLAMLLKLYVDTPIPCYMAVLAMNTLTPTIESICRPRVLGRPRLRWLFRGGS